MDALGSVGCLCQPLGKLTVSLRWLGALELRAAYSPEGPWAEAELGPTHQTGPNHKCQCSECVQLDLTATALTYFGRATVQ